MPIRYLPSANNTAVKAAPAHTFFHCRSEERRVGKECIYRCDWSSDVCSSDLCIGQVAVAYINAYQVFAQRKQYSGKGGTCPHIFPLQIGRASCRERVYISV